MSAALQPMTVAEFLAWEARQDTRHEFDGSAVVAMTGGTWAHVVMLRNLAISVGGRLRGKPCVFAGSEIKIEVAGSIRYPDGLVTCTPPGPGSTVAPNPVVLFEVLSDSTARTDTQTKNAEYAATPSVKRYVVLSQYAIQATVWERTADNDWIGHVMIGPAVLRMPEIGIEVPLDELYEGVDLSQPTD